jgi:hypothetical protein
VGTKTGKIMIGQKSEEEKVLLQVKVSGQLNTFLEEISQKSGLSKNETVRQILETAWKQNMIEVQE